MTKTNYEALARMLFLEGESIREFGEPTTPEQAAYLIGRCHQLMYLTIHLADLLENDNPRFNRELFNQAAGLDSIKTRKISALQAV